MSDALQSQLCFEGVLLFLLGLLGGVAIPAFRSPRIGLSAHLAAIEGGLVLIAVGLVGARLELSSAWAAAIAHALAISLYALWVGLVAGAIWGTGRTLPIAGAGLVAKPHQERIAQLLIVGGSIGSALGSAALLVLWNWRAH
ncbi:MAG TPA: hydroxylaminobenzene mutase [Myxococcota bacterium]|nr:hydroxylaminobenzene mutase [Myxococcota bacterium]